MKYKSNEHAKLYPNQLRPSEMVFLIQNFPNNPHHNLVMTFSHNRNRSSELFLFSSFSGYLKYCMMRNISIKGVNSPEKSLFPTSAQCLVLPERYKREGLGRLPCHPNVPLDILPLMSGVAPKDGLTFIVPAL